MSLSSRLKWQLQIQTQLVWVAVTTTMSVLETKLPSLFSTSTIIKRTMVVGRQTEIFRIKHGLLRSNLPLTQLMMGIAQLILSASHLTLSWHQRYKMIWAHIRVENATLMSMESSNPPLIRRRLSTSTKSHQSIKSWSRLSLLWKLQLTDSMRKITIPRCQRCYRTLLSPRNFTKGSCRTKCWTRSLQKRGCKIDRTKSTTSIIGRLRRTIH